MESRSGTGPSEWPCRKWHSPVPEMVRNESHPIPIMADCQFGDRTKWKISRSGIQKRTVLEMGAITGNGNAISSTCKLRVWVLTNNTPRGHYVVSTIGQKGCFVPEDVKKCIQWDSNPRQLRLWLLSTNHRYFYLQTNSWEHFFSDGVLCKFVCKKWFFSFTDHKYTDTPIQFAKFNIILNKI